MARGVQRPGGHAAGDGRTGVEDGSAPPTPLVRGQRRSVRAWTPRPRDASSPPPTAVHPRGLIITQPVNTATSLAYVVAKFALAGRARRVGGRAFAGPVAGALVLNGVGSVATTGPVAGAASGSTTPVWWP